MLCYIPLTVVDMNNILAVGYGTYSVAADEGVDMYRGGYTTAPSNDYSKGGTMSDMEVKLSYSF